MARTSHSTLRTLMLAGCASLAIAGAAVAQDRTVHFNIPAEDLGAALNQVAQQSGQELVFNADLARGKHAPALRGDYTPQQALDRLLAGSGLSAHTAPNGSLVVEQGAGNGGSAATVEEVVITAEKRPEAVRKISGSVTALSGNQLQALGANSLADYIDYSPGVGLNAATPGLSPAVVRGVSSTTTFDVSQGTTGYFINDVPLTDPYFSTGIPDIDAFDVDNVAVLRGPQGTLFGSASLGGSINYQAAQPNLTSFQASGQATYEANGHDGSGGAGKLMVNVPIASDTFAVRAVYVYRDDPGFIDNIGTGTKAANFTFDRGGRIEATWTPTSTTKVSYLFLDESEDTADNGDEQPTVGGYRKNSVVPEPADFRTLIHSLRLDQDLGFATLTATAAYHEKSETLVTDFTSRFAGFLPGVSPALGVQDNSSKGTTFEVRLASPTGQRLEYLVGAMHDDTRENFQSVDEGANAAQVIETLYGPSFGAGIGAAGAPDGHFFTSITPFRGQESALFGEATYHLNDQWKVTLGGRAFDMKSDSSALQSGFFELLISGGLSSMTSGKSEQSGFTPKASITWTPNKDMMAYFLVSEGYRFGGPNTNPSEPGSPIPPSYQSDSLVNYELGMRTTLFDSRLLLDATAYYVDWSNIQLSLGAADGLAYTSNGGKAVNYGVEGTATWLISPGLMFQTNLTYLEASLASPFDTGVGSPTIPTGTTLPGTSKWRVSNILSYQWLKGPATPTLVVGNRFISKAPGDFIYGLPQGNYDITDARVTFHLKPFDVTAFVDNIADVRGVTLAELSPRPGNEYLVKPRTIGVTLTYKMY